jgi:2-polyprenyl-3-methyl-5-hydroxy-6-metoxy-1,4-benzoquinol methylase
LFSKRTRGLRGTSPIRPWELPRLPDETEHEHQARMNEQYFNEQLQDNEEWWVRIGGSFDFSNRRVLDVGCGHGALAIRIAHGGASEVVGVDVDPGRIAFATKVLHERYPSLTNRVRFLCTDIRTIAERDYYDYVVSKDSFEHIDDLSGVIASILAALRRPGGRLIVGFSPMYYSPLGDHGRLYLPPIVWLHAVLPERVALAYASFKQGRKINSISDLGLNKLTPKGLRSLFPDSTWKVVSLRYNRGCRLTWVLNVSRKLPWLEKYCTVSIYGVFETKAGFVAAQSQFHRAA